MERVKGIEPSYAAWEAAVLPLNYTRVDCTRVDRRDCSAPQHAHHMFPNVSARRRHDKPA
jgi:hypothetical protein